MNKIAIIEDDIDICNMIAKFLENNKYIVHYALNGAEGIELCKSLVPDLIILDIMLPNPWHIFFLRQPPYLKLWKSAYPLFSLPLEYLE